MSTAMSLNTAITSDYHYQQADVRYNEGLGAAMLYMRPSPRACYTSELLEDIRMFHQSVALTVSGDIEKQGYSDTRYTVVASSTPGTYNLGGDLNLFAQLIQRKDRDQLLKYAIRCINVAYQASTAMDLPITTIALVQGNAQGGGFEAALACNVVIAERGVEMGFPEVLFDLFPGMGAYSFLSQRVSPAIAERLILSGKLYSAEELYEMGVIDVLADPGKGHERLAEFIRESKRRKHARDLIRFVRGKYNRVSYEQLLDITRLWVDSALQLSEREIKTMLRLVRAQDRKSANSGASHISLAC